MCCEIVAQRRWSDIFHVWVPVEVGGSGWLMSRLAELDGATVLDRDGRLLTYGAIIASSDSQHEGARTAAAKSLSNQALVVLKVSEDGDITVFSDGEVVATLLPSGLGR